MVPFARAAVTAAILLAASAAHGGEPPTYRCEARGGPAWREYRSAHFTLATDMGAARAEALVASLEYLHALVVKALLGDGVEIPGRVQVVAFASPGDFRKLAASDEIRGYFGIGRFHSPFIVVSGDGFDADEETVAHELAHHVSSYAFARQPRWFAEGLAQFVQTVGRVRGATAAATGTHLVRGGRGSGGRWAGVAPTDLVRWLHAESGGMPRDLLTWSGKELPGEMGRYYVWSWLLYHWLWNTRSKAFGAFAGRLANAEDPAAAWRASFPDLDPSRPGAFEGLQRMLDLYAKNGRFVTYEVKAAPDLRFTVAPLPAAEVHVLLSGVGRGPRDADGLRAELEEALGEQPDHPVAIAAMRWSPAERAAALREAAAARPSDWRAWLLLGDTLQDERDRPEKEAAYRKAIALNEDGATARNNLAWHLLQAGRVKEALPHANAALDLAPWSPAIVDTLAVTAFELGKCKEALVLERRALDLVPKELADERAGLEKTLARIEARCTAPAPPAR